MVAVAHASLAGYLKFRDTPEVAEWLSGPFLKAVCKVKAKEFESAKTVPDHVVLTESVLSNQEVAIVFRTSPRMAEDVQVPAVVPFITQ